LRRDAADVASESDLVSLDPSFPSRLVGSLGSMPSTTHPGG
jgi:hypothetical protein